MRAALYGLSLFYSGLVQLRNWMYDQRYLWSYRSRLPVVCVGNLTVGGNAKTPLAALLHREFKSRGFSPVVLSRGYGGKSVGTKVVNNKDTALSVGDEPYLLFSRYDLTVVVDPNRVRAVKFIEANTLGDIIILDDGLQHRQLERQVNIVIADTSSTQAINKFVAGELLPLGRFREPLKSGLMRADIVVLANRSLKPNQSKEIEPIERLLPSGVQLFRAHLTAGLPQNCCGELLKSGSPVVGFCGIANPEGFVLTLEQLGLKVIGRELYSDHYRFSDNDLIKILDKYPNTFLVCTQKDAVKFDLSDQPRVFVLQTELCVLPADAFIVSVLRKVKERQ